MMTTTKIMKWLKSLCHRHRWCRRTIFQDNLCKLVLHCQTTVDFNGAWDVGNASDATWSSKMCTALVRSPPHHQNTNTKLFYTLDALPATHPPTVTNDWREMWQCELWKWLKQYQQHQQYEVPDATVTRDSTEHFHLSEDTMKSSDCSALSTHQQDSKTSQPIYALNITNTALAQVDFRFKSSLL